MIDWAFWWQAIGFDWHEALWLWPLPVLLWLWKWWLSQTALGRWLQRAQQQDATNRSTGGVVQGHLFAPFALSSHWSPPPIHAVGQAPIASLSVARHWVWLWLWSVWTLLLLALAKPVWFAAPIELPQQGREVMLAIDVSGSMQETDLDPQHHQRSRLHVVKAIVDDFVTQRRGDQLGLIIFGDQAFVQSPLTQDHQSYRQLLSNISVGLAGKYTAIGDAIGLGIKRLQQFQASSSQTINAELGAITPLDQSILILLTDGANTAGSVDPLRAAELAKQVGLRIYTIGVGASQAYIATLFGQQKINPSADLDEKLLQQIAQLTGGQFFRATDQQQLEAIYRQLDQLEPSSAQSTWVKPSSQLFWLPLSLAFVLSLLGLGWQAYQKHQQWTQD